MIPPSPTLEVDVAIIGAGTAGMAAYRAAVRHTDRVLLIEGGEYGTTCARVGCMPSKLLIAAADAAHQVTEAHHFGVVRPIRPDVDGRRVMDRVRSERDRFVGFVTRSIEEFPERHRLYGQARFLDDHTLEVYDTRVRARAIVIATGSRPRVPAMFADLGDRLVVNDDVFAWQELPRSVAVFGPGVIGLELGQALHRLGVRVRVFGVGGVVGPFTDLEIREEARRVFNDEFPLEPDGRAYSLRREGEGVRVVWQNADGERLEDHFEYVLAAVGRTPNIDRLGLENTQLTLDPRGVPHYDSRTLRCGGSHIFIAGDASADLSLLHEAADEGRIAGENAGRYPDVRPGARRSPLAIVFSDPQIAMVGEPWAAVRGWAPVVGRVSFDDQGRSRVMRMNRGRLHLYVDRNSGRLLGAEMLGPRAEHICHLLAWAHQQQLTVDQMLGMPFYHPVVEEGLRTALRDAAAQLEALRTVRPANAA